MIRDYLLCITAAALICCCIKSLLGKTGAIPKLIRLLCGVFLTAVIVKPAVEIRVDDLNIFTDHLVEDSSTAVASGEAFALDEMKQIIKEKSEAYILDKANSLGASLEVEIILADVVPTSVILSGNISPSSKAQISASIAQDLGIPPEDQKWNRS